MKALLKHLFILVLTVMITVFAASYQFSEFTMNVSAHSGRTDSSGGHHDYKNKSGLGSYHYHHGYPAHLHTNGICPYAKANTTTTDSNSAMADKSSAVSSTGSNVIRQDPEFFDYTAVFDSQYYADNNPDLKSIYEYDVELLYQHFLTSGMLEGRQASANFNVFIYKEKNSDLSTLFGDDLIQYYKHYCTSGYKEPSRISY